MSPQRINPAGESRAITHLAVVDGFEKNAGGTRSWRVGIDASIWLEHATYSAGPRAREEDRGKNAELRMLFFRLCKLSRLPVSLVFVFDGRQRPKTKRGSKMGKSGNHRWARGFKQLIELFGMEWREVSGSAYLAGKHMVRDACTGFGVSRSRARVSQLLRFH